jgi:DNA polymerase-1
MAGSKFRVTIDLESDDLLPFCTKIHVVVVKVYGRDEYRVLHDAESLRKIIPFVSEVIGHNILTFDLVVLFRLWGIPFMVDPGGNDLWDGHPVRFTDTLHLSQFKNPDLVGGHSLESFGERLGSPKGDHSDWSEYTPAMLEYCRRDVALTEKVYDFLLKQES